MKDLNYDHSLYYSLKEKHKSLEIKDFKTKNILGSNYIQKNHDLSIQSTPHFINERTVNQLLKKSYHLPIIILYKNKKCLVNPFILNQELYGMCHIIVIPTNKEINYVKINYPNNEKEKLFYEKNFIQTLIQHIRYYMLQENEFYSFSELQQFELLQSYQDDALSSVEVQELFLNEIKNIEKDIIDLQKEYQNKKDILEKLTNINQEYNHLLKQEDEALITIHQDNYKEYQEYIFSIIHKTLMNLSPDNTYRKRDLLKSIERKHHL